MDMPKLNDLTGQRFGRLTVVERAENIRQANGKPVVMWECICDCGNKIITSGRNLKTESTKSCGCYHKEISKKCNNHRIKDITGEKFGRLTAIKIIGYKNGYIWECKCECGKTTNVSLANLNSGNVKSCGCSNKGIIRNYKHGFGRTRIYQEYRGMIDRCKNNKRYYRKRIKICDEWLGENGFINFCDWAMANGYRDDLTIDRKDNDKGYSPDNCRWATAKEQANNRRNNINITINNETKTLKQWCEYYELPYKTVYARLKRGWNEKDALFRDIHK